jgi:aldehyde dehydrogenase (NAD+)
MVLSQVIFKASEVTPLSALAIAPLIADAGFPPGVINIVSGGGNTGALLAKHMRIRLISFTGFVNTGKKVQELAAQSNLKKVILELGGKSPALIFDDTDIGKAVEGYV